MHAKRQTAFSLVEMLVVIAVIAVVISILLPAMQRARQAALRIQCASNLREMGIALEYYAMGNRNYLPWGYWSSGDGNPSGYTVAFDAIGRELYGRSTTLLGHVDNGGKTKIYCPAFDSTAIYKAPGKYYTYAFTGGYGQGEHGPFPCGNRSNIESRMRRNWQIKHPQETVAFYDGGGGWHAERKEWNGQSRSGATPRARHITQFNVSFLDGHVETQPLKFAEQTKTQAQWDYLLGR